MQPIPPESSSTVPVGFAQKLKNLFSSKSSGKRAADHKQDALLREIAAGLPVDEVRGLVVDYVAGEPRPRKRHVNACLLDELIKKAEDAGTGAYLGVVPTERRVELASACIDALMKDSDALDGLAQIQDWVWDLARLRAGLTCSPIVFDSIRQSGLLELESDLGDRLRAFVAGW